MTEPQGESGRPGSLMSMKTTDDWGKPAPFEMQYKRATNKRNGLTNGGDVIEAEDLAILVKRTRLLYRTQEAAGRLMENPRTERVIILLVVAYFIIVFLQLLLPQDACSLNFEDFKDAVAILNALDTAILGLFGLEIILKLFAFGRTYIADVPQLLDAVIIALSIAIVVAEPLLENDDFSRFSQIRGVLRLMRVVLILRKTTDLKEKVQTQVVKSRVMMSTPAQRIEVVLHGLKSDLRLAPRVRRNIKAAISSIASGNLYDINVDVTQLSTENAGWVQQAGAGRKPGRLARSASQNAQKANDKSKDKAGKKSPASKSQYSAASSQVDELGSKNLLDRIAQSSVEHGTRQMQAGQIGELLADFDNWDFDIFKLENASKGNALFVVSAWVFERYRFLEYVKGTWSVFANFVQTTQDSYRAVPYHSSVHAADVVQGVQALFCTEAPGAAASKNEQGPSPDATLLQTCQLGKLHALSMFFAAVVHDVEHPGANNAFQVRARTKFAQRYNDAAVLESHHVAVAYSLLRNGADIFAGLDADSRTTLRKYVVSIVLATDMAQHFGKMAQLLSKVEEPDFFAFQSDDDKVFCMSLAVHGADISNPARPANVMVRWTQRVVAEFFSQGEQEKQAGLSVSMLMDKDTTNIAKSQLGFIDVMIMPYFEALRKVLPSLDRACVHINDNRGFWQERVQLMDNEMRNGKQRLPDVDGEMLPPMPEPWAPLEASATLAVQTADLWAGDLAPEMEMLGLAHSLLGPEGGDGSDMYANTVIVKGEDGDAASKEGTG